MNPPVPAPRPAARPLGWLGVGAIALAIFGFPALLDQGRPQRRPFDERPLKALEKAKPGVVLLGDSMLETRIDEDEINKLTKERWEVLAQPGSSSAIWFLMMKNLIAVQTLPPRVVIIFFRERQLTRPAQRTGGGYRKTIQTYMSASEPEVEKILAGADQRQQTWLERVSKALYPVQWRQEAWRDKVQNKALDLIASSEEFGEIRDNTRDIFKLRNLRTDTGQDFESEDRAQRALDPQDQGFDAAIEESLLPSIIAIAREKNIHLILFRVKGKPQPNGEPDVPSSELVAYDRELKAYLEKAGVQYVDESQDADVTLRFYGSDDHVAPSMLKEYTELFWRKMSPRIPPAPGR